MRHVCFTPKGGLSTVVGECPLCANSRHRRMRPAPIDGPLGRSACQSSASGTAGTSSRAGFVVVRAALILRAATTYQGSALKFRFRAFGLELTGLVTCSSFAALCRTRSRFGIKLPPHATDSPLELYVAERLRTRPIARCDGSQCLEGGQATFALNPFIPR